jgi:hypothetical protein
VFSCYPGRRSCLHLPWAIVGLPFRGERLHLAARSAPPNFMGVPIEKPFQWLTGVSKRIERCVNRRQCSRERPVAFGKFRDGAKAQNIENDGRQTPHEPDGNAFAAAYCGFRQFCRRVLRGRLGHNASVSP